MKMFNGFIPGKYYKSHQNRVFKFIGISNEHFYWDILEIFPCYRVFSLYIQTKVEDYIELSNDEIEMYKILFSKE